jgi:hypothetical protein
MCACSTLQRRKMKRNAAIAPFTMPSILILDSIRPFAYYLHSTRTATPNPLVAFG